MTKSKKAKTTLVVTAIAVAGAIAFKVGIVDANAAKTGIPIHRDTNATIVDGEAGKVEISNTAYGPTNCHVKDPDSRPSGGIVPDGPTVH